MSYQALYRKWRPNHFDDLVGQDHIVRTLTNQIQAGRTSHAYLFCGTRGTGKTSTAKIFARAVNCEDPVDGSPCNTCETCQRMLNHTNLNVIEIDAASNNGVDNIREIREEVKYTPTEGKYKVYIIDEVHMLSTGAFNALLKTLEEPPSHVKFILATTEPHKIPATILSRCQRYDFKRISTETIANLLTFYLKEEEIEAEEKAIRYIGKVADGSMRDGLSVLDQCIAFYLGEVITLEKVLEVLGAVDDDVFYQMTECLIDKNTKGAMDLIESVVMQGRDLSQFLLDQINYFRNLMIVNTIEDAKDLIDVSHDVYESLAKQSQRVNENYVMHLIKAFSDLEAQIKYMSGKRTLIEIELIKLCQPKLNMDTDAVLARLNEMEDKLASGTYVVQGQGSSQGTNGHSSGFPSGHDESSHQVKSAGEKALDIAAIPQDIQKAIHEWTKVVMSTGGLLKSTLKEVSPYYMDDEKLTIVCRNSVQKNVLSEEANMSKIVDVLGGIHDRKFELNIVTEQQFSDKKQANMSDIEEAVRRISQKIKFDMEIKE